MHNFQLYIFRVFVLWKVNLLSLSPIVVQSPNQLVVLLFLKQIEIMLLSLTNVQINNFVMARLDINTLQVTNTYTTWTTCNTAQYAPCLNEHMTFILYCEVLDYIKCI